MKIKAAPSEAPCKNVLLYGPPKSGKSIAASTAPGPILYLNADTPNALWNAHQRSPEGHLQELDLAPLNATDKPIFRTIKEIESALNTGQVGDFKTVAVDPVGDLYRRLLNELSDNAISPSLPTYGAVGTHLERFFRALTESPLVNAVFVAHEYPVQNGDEIERLCWTGTKSNSEQMSQKLMGMVDIVAYSGVVESEGGVQYMAQLVNAKGRRGGDRFGRLTGLQQMNLAVWFGGDESTPGSDGAQAETPAVEPEERSKA